jgi:hypothetical protein
MTPGAELDAGVAWPHRWKVTRSGRGIIVVMNQRRLHAFICLGIGFAILWIMVTSTASAYDTGPTPARSLSWATEAYVRREIVFAPLNHPFDVEAYVSVLFNLAGVSFLAAGFWLAFSRLSFEFAPNCVTRTITVWNKQWQKSLSDGRIELTAWYSDEDDPECTIWEWAIDIHDGKRPWRRLFTERHGGSINRGKEIACELARVTGWEVCEEFYWQDPPDTTSS